MLCKKYGANFEGIFYPNRLTPTGTATKPSYSQSKINRVTVNMITTPTNNETFYVLSFSFIIHQFLVKEKHPSLNMCTSFLLDLNNR
jgi:hypothetical protein